MTMANFSRNNVVRVFISQKGNLNIVLFNPLNGELNPICHLLALLGGETIVVVSRLRVNVIDLDNGYGFIYLYL
jgi:hypothetical protein